MKNIINFKSDRNFIKYLSRCGAFANVIGKSYKGISCLSEKENLVYKAFYGRIYEYIPDEIINEDDVLLDSFLFPKEILCVDGVLKGYSAEFIENDLMPNFHNDFSLEVLEKVDFDSMIRAYYNLVVDTYRLSNQSIMMSDNISNLLFDGNRFIAIGTYGYKIVRDNPTEINQRIIRDAITIPLDLAVGEYDSDLSSKIVDIENYLREVEKITKEHEKQKKLSINHHY